MFISTLEARLFGRSITLAIISPLIYLGLAYWIPKQIGNNLILKPLADTVQGFAGTAALVVFTYAVLQFLYSSYQYWLWINQHIPSCPRCGMLMQQRTGRYGLFWGCMRYPACRGTMDL